MIDFHTHILPELDDGSRSIAESLEMLHMEYEQGVRQIIATPHFYAHKDSVTHFLRNRDNARQRLAEAMQEMDEGIEVLTGSEVYYFPGIGRAEQLSRLCVDETSVLLLELPFTQWTDTMYKDVKDIIERQRCTVLLAHIERYYEFQKTRDIWKRIFELPLYAQINTGRMDSRKKRHFVTKFMKSGVPFVLGSDCHNAEGRPPNMQEGREVIRKRWGAEVLQQINDTGERLLRKNE